MVWECHRLVIKRITQKNGLKDIYDFNKNDNKKVWWDLIELTLLRFSIITLESIYFNPGFEK